MIKSELVSYQMKLKLLGELGSDEFADAMNSFNTRIIKIIKDDDSEALVE